MKIEKGSRTYLATVALVLCAAHLLVATTVDAHGDVDGPRRFHRGTVAPGEGEGESGNHVVRDRLADRSVEERVPLRVAHGRDGVREFRQPEEEKPPEPFWAKAWSYVIGFADPVPNVFNPLTGWGRKLARPADEKEKHRLEHPHPHDHGHGHGHGPDHEAALRHFRGARDVDGAFVRFHEHHHGPSDRLSEDSHGPLRKFHRSREEHHGPHVGPRHHHPNGMLHSFFKRIRDAMGKGPDGEGEMKYARVDSKMLSEDEMDTKVLDMVLKAVDEYSQTEMAVPQNGTACIDCFQEQLRTLIWSVKLALKEQVCADDAASGYNICKLRESSPFMAALMAFSKARVNPITMALTRTSAICDSPDLLDSLHQMEILTNHIQLDNLERHLVRHDGLWEHFKWGFGRNKSRFGKFWGHHEHHHREKSDELKESDLGPDHREHEQKKHERKEHEHKEDKEHEHKEDKEHEHKEDKEHEHKEHEHKEHEHKEHEHKEYEHKEHEHNLKEDKHHGSSLLGMVHRLKHAFKKHIHHREFRGVLEHDCFVKGVHRTIRGLRREVNMMCSSPSSPELMRACKFSAEQRLLTRSYIGLKTAMMEHTVSSHCAAKRLPPKDFRRFVRGDHPLESEMGSTHLPLQDVESSALETDMPHLKRFSRGCARHRARQAFRKAMLLRGHLLDAARAAQHEDLSNGEVLNTGSIHAQEAAMPDLLDGVIPDMKDTVTQLMAKLDAMEIEDVKPITTSLDPNDQTNGVIELRLHNAIPRKSVLGPMVGDARVEFPMTARKRRPHLRISARLRTIPSAFGELKEKVDIDASHSSTVASTDGGH